ncbi:MAG: LamG-like jellyroll fold domain-containing protein [Akkermansiaceae bacterium]
MKHIKIKHSVGLMIGLSSLLPAAQITWETPMNMFSGDANDASFVSTSGVFIDAVNGGGIDATVNGILFTGVAGTATDGQNLSSANFSFTNHNDNAGAFGQGEFAGGTAGVGDLIQSAFWRLESVTMSGLTVGDEYQVQILANDARGNRSDNFMVGYGDGLGGATAAVFGILNNQANANGDGPAGTGGATGQYFIGTFIADAATQSFNVFGTNSGTIANLGLGDSRAHVNAIQLRLLPPDQDGDGISNAFEDANGLDRSDPSDAALDPDDDGLTNLQEFLLGTAINDNDSDDDLLLDGEEVNTYGTNPLLTDTDEDTLDDNAEINIHLTNPLLADSDVDGLSDADEVNIHSTDPNLADSDSDGINDPTEILISLTDPNLDTSVPTLDPDSVDLLAYWDFNNGTDATQTVDLINGYVGSLNEGTTFTASGEGHTGIAGDLAIDLGDTAGAGTGVNVELGEFFNLASINDQFSISFWQKLDTDQPTGATSSVGASRYGVDRAIMAHLPFTDGNIYFDHGGGTANRISGPPVSAVDWQQWNHITLVKNGDAKEVWVNGSLAISGENLDAPVENNHFAVFLGVDDVNRNIIGQVDDFAFYADPLNSTQILALANGADPRNMDSVLADADGDGMPDTYENLYGLNPAVNDADLDLDNDMLTNIEEFTLGTIPNDNDTDDDGYLDGVETNTGIWVSATDTGTDPFLEDTDGDTLLDGVENPDLPFVDATQTGTNPLLADTDADTYTDAEEIAFGSDPLDPNSLAANVPEIVLYYDFNGDSLSRVEDGPNAELVGGAVISADGGGFSGEAGDQSLDLGTTASAGTHAAVAGGEHFLSIEANNTVAISWWQKRTGDTVPSAAFAAPNVSNGRGLQSHAPWENGLFYVDLMGVRRTVADPTVADVWQHFVIQQHTDGTVELWIDGEMTNEWPQAGADQQFALTGAVFIGATIGGGNNMTGQLDEFAIFSGPIPGPHIQRLAAGETVGEYLNLGPQPLVINSIVRSGDDVTLTWNSKESELFNVFFSFDMINWDGELDDGILADPGTQTTRTFNMANYGLENEAKVFFRVEK